MSKWIKWIFVLLLAGTASLWFVFRPNPHQKEGEKNEPRNPASVRTFKVQWINSQSFNEFAGTVQSRVTVQISPRITAHIQEIPVHAGAIVKKGDLLVRMDDGDIRARLKQAQSGLASAEATLEEVYKDFARYQDLVNRNIESKQKLDQIEAKVKNARAGVESAKQQVAEVQETLGYTEIKASSDAVVVEKFAEPGDLAAPNRILLTLQDPASLRIEVPVSEQCARRIRVGDSVWTQVASAEAELETRVSEIVPVVDPKSRSFLVRSNLPFQQDMKPGMFGRLRFPCAPRKIIAIPRSALMSKGQLDMVFLAFDGLAKLRLVRLGEEYKGKVEILSGLSEGEMVILNPAETLRDGDTIVMLPEEKS